MQSTWQRITWHITTNTFFWHCQYFRNKKMAAQHDIVSRKIEFWTINVFEILRLIFLDCKHVISKKLFSIQQNLYKTTWLVILLIYTSHFRSLLSQNILPSDPSSWQRLEIILWTSPKRNPPYWIWRRSWLSSRTLG